MDDQEYSELLQQQSHLAEQIQQTQQTLAMMKLPKPNQKRDCTVDIQVLKENMKKIQMRVNDLSTQLVQLKATALKKREIVKEEEVEEEYHVLQNRITDDKRLVKQQEVIRNGLLLLETEVERALKTVQENDKQTVRVISREFKVFCKQLVGVRIKY